METNEQTAAAVLGADDDAELSGIIPELGSLGAGAVVTERGLAELMGRCPLSIKRSVDRGELPRPIRLMGQPCWTVGVIVDHLNRRLADAQKERRDLAVKIEKLRP